MKTLELYPPPMREVGLDRRPGICRARLRAEGKASPRTCQICPDASGCPYPNLAEQALGEDAGDSEQAGLFRT